MPRERSPPDAVLQIEQLERQDSGSGVSKGAATPSAIALKAQKDAQAAARGNSLRQVNTGPATNPCTTCMHDMRCQQCLAPSPLTTGCTHTSLCSAW